MLLAGDAAIHAEVDASRLVEGVDRPAHGIAANSVKVKDLPVSDKLRPALKAISLKLNGKKAADNTVARKRTVLSNALRYAVERDLLDVDPLTRIDWSAPETDDEVDFRYVPEPKMARELIDAVPAQGPRGEDLYAFLGCMYAANRPSEVADLKESDLVLPQEGWGEMILAGSRPEVGSGWTDDGKPYEERGLKRRAPPRHPPRTHPAGSRPDAPRPHRDPGASPPTAVCSGPCAGAGSDRTSTPRSGRRPTARSSPRRR
ncbi:hypothetical protein [Streptomyces lateritius]|uniref:hypothetical protein n=1 Tax=Streptomyces lateritius TaxID=67313 RepID=UPI0019CD2B19|nr:hypothetical protein [Streptomyces lateritius]GGT67628.1 hypothetical protein GCM10010272_07880 [Streptomyces lateritius]